MKKVLSLIFVLFVCTSFIFADEPGDEYDDGYFYETNGAGDQFLKIGIMPYIPLNFDNKLIIGGAGELGYYRFLNRCLAIGGEVNFSFNITLANNVLTTLPILFGVTAQYTVGKFEFPVMIGIGMAYETAQNSNYFPGFAMKLDVGGFFRATEAWSFGLTCKAWWLPQWFADPKYNDDGFFLAPALSLRYHF